MDVKLAIRHAVQSEEYAKKLYLKMANQSKTISEQHLFERLAKEEEGHKIILQKLDPKAIHIEPRARTLMLAKDLMLTPLNELGELKKNLRYAIRKEKDAQKRYADMAVKVQDKKVKQLFSRLEKMEKHHEEMLQKEYDDCFA